MLSARKRHNKSTKEGTQKFITTSALRVSPYVRGLIEQFRKENKPQSEEEENESKDDIEIEVRPFISSFQVSTHMNPFHAARTRRTMITWSKCASKR